MTLVIYGAGGQGREILDLAQSVNQQQNKWREIVFCADNPQSVNENINGIKIFSFSHIINVFSASQAEFIVAVGEPAIRKELAQKIKNAGYKLSALISPGAFIGGETVVENGVVVQFGAYISCNCKIEFNALIQQNAYVAHDCTIGENSVISALSAICGGCVVGSEAYIGAGANVKEGITIGSEAIIGLGAAVVSEIDINAVAFGNPAKQAKKNISKRVFAH